MQQTLIENGELVNKTYVEQKNYYIYKHKTPNGKVYIGQTCKTPNKRWANGYGYKGQVFYNAILKYGWENIEHEILFEGLSKEEADKKEIEMISFYNSSNPKYGYNISFGGSGTPGVRLSNEIKQKISNAHKGMMRSEESRIKQSKTLKGHTCSDETRRKIGEANKRRIWSEESRKKLSESQKGKIISDETKRKISESSKGRSPSIKNREITARNNSMRIWSEESRKKSSESHKGIKASNRKMVLCVETGVIYDSAEEAAKSVGLKSHSSISQICSGKRRGQKAGGYTWLYCDNADNNL